MPGNTAPIFSKAGIISMRTSSALGVASNRTTTVDGTNATTDKLLYTAGSEGSFLQRIRFKSLGTNAVAVARIYINNGSDQTVATNNLFYGELSLPATTASTTIAMVDMDFPLNFVLPGGYRIIVGVSAAADLATGWTAGVIGGTY